MYKMHIYENLDIWNIFYKTLPEECWTRSCSDRLQFVISYINAALSEHNGHYTHEGSDSYITFNMEEDCVVFKLKFGL